MAARAAPSSDQSLAVPSLEVDMKPTPGARSSERTGPECSRRVLICPRDGSGMCGGR